MSESVPDDIKQAVIERANKCCEYCWSQSRSSSDPLSVEHIVPSSRGGSNKLDNLASSCQGCNNFKFTAVQGTDTATGRVVPLYHPRRDSWHDHFAWNEDFTIIVGKTPVGRATVERLRLNRPGVTNLRTVLGLVGRHSPHQDTIEKDVR